MLSWSCSDKSPANGIGHSRPGGPLFRCRPTDPHQYSLGWGDEDAVSGPEVQSVTRGGPGVGMHPSRVSANALVPPRVGRRPDRRPSRALDRRVAAGDPQCPRPRAPAATRSASWSSTCRRCAARLDPKQGLGRTARDQGPAGRERGRSRRRPGSRPPRSHRGWNLRAIGGSRSETAGTVRPISSRPGLRRRRHALVPDGPGSARTR